MTPKQYLAVQLQLLNLARQVLAVKDLPDFIAAATEAKRHEDSVSDRSPQFEEARAGLEHIRQLATSFLVVAERCAELDAYFHKTRHRVPLGKST